MKKTKLMFEQVPVRLVKEIAKVEASLPSDLVPCVVCGKSIELEKCKTDENGAAVHDKCYLARMSRTLPGSQAFRITKSRASL